MLNSSFDLPIFAKLSPNPQLAAPAGLSSIILTVPAISPKKYISQLGPYFAVAYKALFHNCSSKLLLPSSA